MEDSNYERHFFVVAATVILVWLLTPLAAAQTACPYGATPGSSSCGPDPSQQASGLSQPPAPTGWWESTFGALAADVANNAVGTGQGYSSREEAEHFAVSECRKNGGGNCEILSWVKNGCLALAWPYGKGGGTPATATGKRIREAERRALGSCIAKDGRCEVVVSSCNQAKFHKS